MNKDYYEYKDIILGIREENKETSKKLNKLKEMTEVVDHKIIEYDYWIHRWQEFNSPELMCEAIKPNPIWKNHQNNLNSIIILDNKEAYFNRSIGLLVKPSRRIEFYEEAKDILSNQYVKKMYSKYIQGHNGNLYHSVGIAPSIIRSSVYKGLESNLTYQYNLVKDELGFIHYPYQIDNELLEELVHLKYPKSSFPRCIQEIIEKQEEKEMILEHIKNPTTDMTLKLEENKNKVYLKRKN